MTTATRRRPIPPHGSEGRFRGHRKGAWPPCRCTTCVRGNRRIRIQREQERLHNIYRRVPAAPVAAHITNLTDAGMSIACIARLADVPAPTIRHIRSGRSQTCKRNAARRLLAVQPGTRDHIANQPAIGSTRRVRALYAIGHSAETIAASCALSRAMICDLAAHRYQELDGRTAAEVTRAYRVLSARPGSSPLAIRRARIEGWHTPIAWDDIDDPDARPEAEIVVDQRRHKSDPIDPDLVARLTALGLSAAQIAERLGCNPRSIVRARRRAEETAVAA